MLRFGHIVSISFSAGYLLTDVVEASVFSVALVSFSQNRVEGFVAIPPGCPCISRDGEHCHVNLRTCIFYLLISSPLNSTVSKPPLVRNLSKANSPFSHMDHQCGWRCPVAQSTPALHWVSAAKTPAHWERLAWRLWTGLCLCCCTRWSWCRCGCCLFLGRGGQCDDLDHSNANQCNQRASHKTKKHQVVKQHNTSMEI